MAKKLFLLDGMALVYRAHFALIARPIFNSKGINTSALYGFTQTILDILGKQQPTHLAVAMDTEAPTPRHTVYPDYKATRQTMPEDLSAALPHVRRMLEALRIPLLECDGYEADDIVGTLARKAEKQGFQTYMVTPDKDFGQLVDENTFLYKPSRSGEGVEILGVAEIQQRWGIQKPEQVIDVLALMGDSSDNIPGVPGIGEKTAIKLIGEFGTVEALLERTAELKGRVRETLEKNRELALLSKQLVTILCDAPCAYELEELKLRPPDEEAVKAMCVEFEFNSIGRRLFGDDFKAGRGFAPPPATNAPAHKRKAPEADLVGGTAEDDRGEVLVDEPAPAINRAELKKLADVSHDYRIVPVGELDSLLARLAAADVLGFKTLTCGGDPKEAVLEGLAFSFKPHEALFVRLPNGKEQAAAVLGRFRSVLANERSIKVGHNLKFDLSVLKWHGMEVRGRLFDPMVAHSLIEPDTRHALDFLSEAFLGYTPSTAAAAGQEEQLTLGEDPSERLAERAMEAADLALQLRAVLEPLLEKKGQHQVFYDIEAPLIPVLVQMEHEGIRIDHGALNEFAAHLSAEMNALEKSICEAAGREFNLNSTRQLGEVLFDVLKVCEKPKKTRTGQYATDEQTLMALAPEHEVVQRLLEYRAASKLKSTYADALPQTVWPATGRIHTTYNQVATATGRLNSQNPNLQNIPIRTDKGQEIRRAFVPRDRDHALLSADYSQIELRIIAALSQEAGLLEAFRTGVDVHTATAARVYGVALAGVTAEMRRKAKMVNYGIAYGISAFGLAQRLNIPRREGAEIINQYFAQFSGIREFMDRTIQFARKHGYVETVTGRRRYLRDVTSSNATVRSAAERNAINAPIQGTAADMIKVAMIRIHGELERQGLRTRMLLQVHDELVFDLHRPEEEVVVPLVRELMKTAIPLEVPIEVEVGVGETWLAAH
ncbi:MAG TPA: DNA polymerase I [Verrucomicrobiae bacterium]|nr:DNA polymerase I [Verrucomicrobiae bacterium]